MARMHKMQTQTITMSSSHLLLWNWLICKEVLDPYADVTPSAETQEERKDDRHMTTAFKGCW
jgi:hypothetical protein